MIAHIQHSFKTYDLGNGLVHDPDHINSAADADHGCGGFYLKAPFLKFHQVLCEDLEFAYHYPEFSVSFFFFGFEIKLVQVKVGLFTHGHEAAVLERQPQPRICVGLELIMEMERHAQGHLHGLCDPCSGNGGRSLHPGDFTDYVRPIGTRGRKNKQHCQD